MHLTGVNMTGVAFASIIVAAPQPGCITHLLLAMVTHLGEEVGGEQRQGPVLAAEAVVVRVEGKVVQIEESASGKQTNLLVRTGKGSECVSESLQSQLLGFGHKSPRPNVPIVLSFKPTIQANYHPILKRLSLRPNLLSIFSEAIHQIC